jgi:N-acetylglucosamine-6-phosphate deacetylase
MTDVTFFTNANLILPDRVIENGTLTTEGPRIVAVQSSPPKGATVVDLRGQYLSPGFVDVHVHGGAGHDFMDLTPEAFQAIAACHARHGTTSFTPTSTTGPTADSMKFLELCQTCVTHPHGARNLGGHLYGPYFAKPARGCHPTDGDYLTPHPTNWEPFLKFALNGLTTLTVAAELEGVADLIHAMRAAGVNVNVGHSYATFEQTEAAFAAGAGHVDHLFCAMSDRARLRLAQAFPMRAGVMEATLANRHVCTEVIADGWHLHDSLLKFAYRMKGPDRLCLVTDSMRAVDLPDGEYWFGPVGRGTLVRRQGEVGVTPDGSALGSGVMGMSHHVRIMARATSAPLPEVIRMATLTPAKMLGCDRDVGSLDVGKFADLVVLDRELNVCDVWIDGQRALMDGHKNSRL